MISTMRRAVSSSAPVSLTTTWSKLLDASISEAAHTIRLGEVLAARGETTVALNEHGRLTRYQPDGTTSPLE